MEIKKIILINKNKNEYNQGNIAIGDDYIYLIFEKEITLNKKNSKKFEFNDENLNLLNIAKDIIDENKDKYTDLIIENKSTENTLIKADNQIIEPTIKKKIKLLNNEIDFKRKFNLNNNQITYAYHMFTDDDKLDVIKILKDKDLYKNFNQDKLKDILGKDYEKVIENTNNNQLKLK